MNKLLDWTHDDFDMQHFLQDDGSWPIKPQLDHSASLPPQLELHMVHYYRSDGHSVSDDRGRGMRDEIPLINHYRRPDGEVADMEQPTGFFSGVFETGIFSRLSSSPPKHSGQEFMSEPDPEPEPAGESGQEPQHGTNFIHSVLDRLSPFDKPAAEEFGVSDSEAPGQDGPTETVARATVGRDEQDEDIAESEVRAVNEHDDNPRPLIPVKRLKVASYQMRTDEKTGKEFTVYQIKCFPVDELATAPWVVSRRFSAFSDLRESLGSAIAKIPFPSRHMSLSLWGATGKHPCYTLFLFSACDLCLTTSSARTVPSQSELDERRLELEVWLISVLGLRQKDERMLRFLNLETSRAASLAKPSPLSLHTPASVGGTVGVQDAKEPVTPIGVYRCVRRTVVRESWQSWSEKIGILEEGVEVKVLEERLNSEGVLRARFISTGVDLAGGWCSVRTADGQTILDLTFRQ